MIFDYNFKKEDYLSALSLQTANSRQSVWITHLLGMAAVGCAIYLSLSTLRGTLFADDTVSYAAALFAVAVLLFHYSPKILPALLFDYNLKTGKIPAGTIGWHTFEVREDAIVFRYGNVEHKTRYCNLIRVNHNEDTVLFYMQTGMVEAVPTRTFGFASERNSTLSVIERRINAAYNSPKPEPPIEPYAGSNLYTAKFAVSTEDFFHCNRVHTRHLRRKNLKKPMTLFWAAAMLLIASGAIKGLAQRVGGIAPPMEIVTVYYVLGLIGCAVGVMLLVRPLWLVNWGLRQRIKMRQVPYGFFGEHKLQWCEEWLAQQYGLIGVKLPWSAFTEIFSDERFIYLYQGESLAFFLPKSCLGEKASTFMDSK